MYVAIATLSWGILTAVLLGHALLSWFLLWLAGEGDLTSDVVTFAYYYMTTATTVGYGDLSPTGHAGRLADIFVVLPGSIAVFTAVLGKVISDISGFWRRRLQGYGDFSDRTGHTLVVGWQGARTRSLIDGLLQDNTGGERIVILATSITDNPMPDVVDFVLADELSHIDSYARAGAAGAAAVVVRGGHDDETLAATLAARATAGNAHIVAFFENDSAASLVRRQFSEIEVLTSISSELLVRSARDPGSSRLADLMFSGHTVDTAYSMRIPPSTDTMHYFDLFCGLKKRYDLTLIGVSEDGNRQVDLNCSADSEVRAGDTIFYIGDVRADPATLEWGAIQAEAAL